MTKPIEVTDDEFEEEVLQAELPVLVDFWATWCAPCKIVGPIVEELADEYDGRVKFVKLDTAENFEVPDDTASAACPLCWCSRAVRRSTRSSARDPRASQLVTRRRAG